MKLAFVHDWLIDRGGAENALLAMLELFPNAPIFTLFHDPKGPTQSLVRDRLLYVSALQRFPNFRKIYRNLLPLFPLAIEQFDLLDYDLIISSSHAVAKGVLAGPDQLHISYVHSPARYAWDLQHQYLQEADLTKGVRSIVARVILHYLRIWDVCAANRVDEFIVNSRYVAQRVERIYRRRAKIIYPPVDVDFFNFYSKKEEYYVTVSRFVPYKKVNLIVEVFARLPNHKLIVIGDGPDREKIASLAGKNVELVGYQPRQRLRDYLQSAKGFIYAAEEDFGIAVVEAQACGTPVIVYGKGGTLETVVEGKTGLFFSEQSVESLLEAIRKFESCYDSFDPRQIRTHAEKFSRERFQREFQQFVESAWNRFREKKKRSIGTLFVEK